MDLFEVWQRKRFKKLRQTFEPSRAGVESGEDTRIPPACIVAEDNMVRAQQLRPMVSAPLKQVSAPTVAHRPQASCVLQ